MIQAGDELGRTQGGNNNAYCQDNEVSWIDWENADRELLAFTASLLAFRRAHPVFRRRRWFEGRSLLGGTGRDIAWFTPAGHEMAEQDWSVAFAKSLMVFLDGKSIPNRGPRGEEITDDSFLLCFNAHHEPMSFILPPDVYGSSWRRVIDTADPRRHAGQESIAAGGALNVADRALVVLQRVESANPAEVGPPSGTVLAEA